MSNGRRQITYYVRPRYSPGSPSMVNVSTAARVSQDERDGYAHALSGIYGTEQQARAVALGLAGIVEQWAESTRGSVNVYDLLTQASYTITSAQRDLLRELHADERRYVEIITGQGGEVAFIAGPHCHRKVRTADVRALAEARRLRRVSQDARFEQFHEWARWRPRGEEVAHEDAA